MKYLKNMGLMFLSLISLFFSAQASAFSMSSQLVSNGDEQLWKYTFQVAKIESEKIESKTGCYMAVGSMWIRVHPKNCPKTVESGYPFGQDWPENMGDADVSLLSELIPMTGGCYNSEIEDFVDYSECFPTASADTDEEGYQFPGKNGEPMELSAIQSTSCHDAKDGSGAWLNGWQFFVANHTCASLGYT